MTVSIEDLARRHGVSVEAVQVLQDALRRGGGRQAQFSHRDLGGMGQWSAGGMTQVGDMFNTALKDRVNALCSGRINTERVRQTYGIPGQPGQSHDPMKVDEQIKAYPFWFGEPEDMAAIALFLASDESRMITGAAIPADGGRSAY